MDRAPRPRRPARRLRAAGVALLVLAPVAAVLSLVVAPPARAATPGTYLVTFVARSCPNYTDITANLARNNIQENLQDLGADTLYTSGQPINPTTEQQGQPLNNPCTALAGWNFTFGNGVNGKTPNTNLSRVSNPVSPPSTTQASVPLLDTRGNPTGSTITGAVTTTLTAAQVTQASNHQLWVQGGTPTSPLGDATHGFGALRCAIDNVNGDNVEWVGFPTGQSHVFCYYYAVALPPPPGTITVVKQLGPSDVGTNTFQFQGNVSYNPGGAFEIPVSGTSAPSTGSISFVRASNNASNTTPWAFEELPIAGFTPSVPTSSSCTAVGPDGTPATATSTWTTPNPTAPYNNAYSVSVVLGAHDHVTCTFVDTRNPPPTSVTLYKQTSGGFGGPFAMTVASPTVSSSGTVSTSAADTPVLATSLTDATQIGTATWTLTDDYSAANAPANVAVSGGTWSVSGFDCNGIDPDPLPPTTTQTIQVPSGAALLCTFTNLFTPTGSITLTKSTTGGVGTTNFVVTPVPDANNSEDVVDPVQLLQSATTTQPGVPATATGDSLANLPVGTNGPSGTPQKYLIAEEGPDDSTGGTWNPQSISCDNGVTVPAGTAEVAVALSPASPHVTCAFTNAFTATPPSPTTTTTTTSTSVPTSTTTSTVPGGVAADDTGQSGGSLAMTGEDVRLPLGIAAALALTGATLLLVERARRRTVPAVADRRDEPPPG